MKIRFLILGLLFFAAILCFVACGPTTYVQAPPQQGYVAQQPYVQQEVIQPYYDPLATAIMLNGVMGFYDSYHTFHTSVTINGASGYYDSSHRFVSSAPAVREAYQSHRPFYSGPSSSGVRAQTNTTTITNNGTISRGAASPAARPNYGSGPGTISRGSASTAPTARPAYSNSVGSASRGFSAPSRPSYSSSSGSISRHK